MQLQDLVAFAQRHRWAVQASVHGHGGPQAAVVGVAVSPLLEVVFDTLGHSRKAVNLRRDPRIALVLGWDEEQTLQLEGRAEEPTGAQLQAAKALYFSVFPDGRQRESWPGMTWFRVVPRLAIYSDFRAGSSTVVRLEGASLC